MVSRLELVSNTKTIEYGESYTPNLKDFVEEKNVNKYSIDGNIPNEEGKEYPAIGEYKLTVKKNKKSEEVTVNSANVNYGVVGKYKSELIATDESGNTSQKQITVTVTENNGTETPETVTEASGNLPNNNNTTTGISNQGYY